MNDIEILENKIQNVKKYNTYSYSWTEQDIEAIENLIQRNKELEQIEQEHKEENGRLRDRIKELEEIDLNNSKIIANMSERHFHDRKKIRELEKSVLLESKPIVLGMIPISELKEIVDECIPKKENIITKELEYTPNANANSFLTQRILELLEESDK